MSAYVQRCVLCGSDGDCVRRTECKWCGGEGIRGNGEAETTRGQLHAQSDRVNGTDVRTTVSMR